METLADVRVPHKGNVADQVVEGAYEVLNGFERVHESRNAMRAITLDQREAEAFAGSALGLRFDDKAPPITERQILRPLRPDDDRPDLWSVFNRVQEHLTKGGVVARNANGQRQTTRAVRGIDQNVKLNRALWLLADRMQQLKHVN